MKGRLPVVIVRAGQTSQWAHSILSQLWLRLYSINIVPHLNVKLVLNLSNLRKVLHKMGNAQM